MKKDILVAGFILAVSFCFFLLTLQIEGVAGYESMGPAFWPRFTLIGMMILAVVIMLRALIASRENQAAEAETDPSIETSDSRKNLRPVFISAGILVCSIVAIPYLGFVLSAFLTTAGLIYYLGEKRIWVALLVSFGLVTSIYLLFGKLMYVPMPRGVWIFQDLSNLLY